MKFRDLSVGQHFKFDNRLSDRYSSTSFTSTAKKVSSRCYVWAGKKGVRVKLPKNWETIRMRVGLLMTCVGSINVGVVPTGRRSPMKKRGGRNRGKKIFAGY